VIAKNPQDVVAKNGRAEVLKAQGKLDDALRAYEDVIAKNPENIVARNGRAELLKAQGKLDDALRAYNEVIAKNPENIVARTGRAEVLKAQGKLDDALRAYDEVLAKNPQDVVAKNGRAEVLKAQGKLDDALRAYDDVIAKNPESIIARNGRASILLLSGKLQSKEIFAQLPSQVIQFSDWVLYHIGCIALITEGAYQSAVSKLRFGLENDQFPQDRPYFISALATALIFDKQFTEGLHLLESIQDTPDSAIATARNRILKAHALFEQKNREEGIRVLGHVSDNGYPMVGQAKAALEMRYLGNLAPADNLRLDAEIKDLEFRLLAMAA
jgi:thioredoxin-like negative regulator of GroEL